MIVLPENGDYNTLFGEYALAIFDIVLDVCDRIWYFLDEPDKIYEFVEVMENIQLREDEDQSPISVPPYRMANAKREILLAEVDRMLEMNIIEECDSSRAAPMVLVNKSDGSVHTIYFSTQNEQLTSAIDLRSGYWQVAVCESDRDNAAFISPFEEEAYSKLMMTLTSTLLLRQADFTQPYALCTDSSNYALGAVLTQRVGADEHPVKYTSRLLTKCEMNYTTERKALAIVWPLQKFREYVECSKVVVSTDHQLLRWLMSLKTPTGRLARWALQIQAIRYSVQNAEINLVVANFSQRSCEYIWKKQLLDTDLKKIIEADSPNNEFVLIMMNGVLYRYDQDSDSEGTQLLVTTLEREQVLKEFHDSETAGHNGVERTFQRISRRYYLLEQENRWILVVEDYCTRWVEVFMRYGLLRRIISDNGTQFISEVMQQTAHILGIHQSLIATYDPQANPTEEEP
ncbi:hypothetical protein Trydic_g1758 [Trypoxylus dichotomus]